MSSTALIRKASIEELCGHRNRALELYDAGLNMLREACKAHLLACPGKQYASTGDILSGYVKYASGDRARTDKELRQAVDRDMWKSLIEFTRIGSLMDRKERETFEKELEANPPEVTPATASATFERLVSDAETIFRRGLINAFARFCRDYKSNDGFKIGEKIVVEYGVTWDVTFSKFRENYHRQDDLRDLDRVVHILAGQPSPEYQSPSALGNVMRQAFDVKDGPKEARTPYWRVKWFKKGTVHLELLDKDLRHRANRMIAEHYGETLGAGPGTKKSSVDPMTRAGDFTQGERNFFATPRALAERVIDEACIHPDMKVLEPSAGRGRLAEAARATGAKVDCFEIDRERNMELAAMGFPTHCIDFLRVPASALYERIVMNPPFARQQDILHVLHAWGFLKPGGRLVAIMSAGVTFRDTALNRQLQELIDTNGGVLEELPEGSFAESGTGVRTFLLTLDKPL